MTLEALGVPSRVLQRLFITLPYSLERQIQNPSRRTLMPSPESYREIRLGVFQVLY